MRRWLCILLAILLVMSPATPAFANEIEEAQYGSIKVEYSDAIGSIEYLDVMVQDSWVFADANVLSDRLGYQCKQEGNVVNIYAKNNFFYHKVPLLAVHFKINSTDVSYNPMFGAEYQYDAPAPCVKNDKGIWIPLQYSIYLLGGHCNILQDTMSITMPRENVLSIAAMIANNATTISFDWEKDFGYSETAANIAGNTARIVTLFKGLLEFDGNAWLSLIDWNAFDRKFGYSLATMFTTNSSDELRESVEEVEKLLDVFHPDGMAGSMLRNKRIRIDSDVTAWKTACEEYLELLRKGSGSPAKYNLLYNQYKRVLNDQELFAKLGGDDIIYIQNELSSASNVLDIASKIGKGVSYLHEFQQRDTYKASVLKSYLSSRIHTDDLPDATANAMLRYTDSGAGKYADMAVQFFLDNALEFVVDDSGLDALMGTPSQILLFAWDIMSAKIPFYDKGLKAVEKREISNHAQKLQNDAFYNLKNMMGKLQSKPSISTQDCMQLSEYCYIYLKASYIARSAAVASLDSTSKEFKEQVTGKLTVAEDTNQIIARYLAILSNANEENALYILGFLPENNEDDFVSTPNETLLAAVVYDAATLVSDAYYDYVPKTLYGGEGFYHIPKVNANLPEIDKTNGKIYDDYYSYMQTNVYAVLDEGTPIGEISYIWGVKDQYLSILMRVVWGSDQMFFPYTISLETGEILEDSKLLSAYGLTWQDCFTRIIVSCLHLGQNKATANSLLQSKVPAE